MCAAAGLQRRMPGALRWLAAASLGRPVWEGAEGQLAFL